MLMSVQDEIVRWLRDAYAMERGMEVTLKKVAESDRHALECRNLAAAHLEETRQHAQTIERLLKSLGSDTSTIKMGAAMMTETIKGLGTAMSQDEEIKDLLASYAMEHFEIACYRALVAAAELAGFAEIADACEQIISDEENMAEGFTDALPRAVQDHLRLVGLPKAA